MKETICVKTAGLSRRFETRTRVCPVLRDVSFTASAGEMTAILGESGSGKTTLLQILGLMDRPDAGSYYLDGEDTAGWNERKRAAVRGRKIGFVFQQFRLLGALTAAENTAYPLALAGIPGKERKKRAEAALEQVGLLERAGHLPSALSGGQQQRVALARALITRPGLILADEPTGNLDPRAAEQVTDLLTEQCRMGRCVVLITHSPRVAAAADRIFQLKNGCLIPFSAK